MSQVRGRGVLHSCSQHVSILKFKEALSIPIGKDLCFGMVATGCYPRILEKFRGSKGLYKVAPMLVLLLCRDQVGLEDAHKALDVHRHLLLFLVS